MATTAATATDAAAPAATGQQPTPGAVGTLPVSGDFTASVLSAAEVAGGSNNTAPAAAAGGSVDAASPTVDAAAAEQAVHMQEDEGPDVALELRLQQQQDWLQGGQGQPRQDWRRVPAEAWAPHAAIVGGTAVLAEVQLCAMQGRKPGEYYPVLGSLPLLPTSALAGIDGSSDSAIAAGLQASTPAVTGAEQAQAATT